jgi:hypothetical protein
MASSDTVVYTTLKGDTEPVQELPVELIRYGYRQSRPGSISFKLAIDHEKCTSTNIEEGKHEVVVERNKALVWAGPVWTSNEGDTEVEFGGEGLLSYLDQWVLTAPLTFTQDDQFTIARALLDHHLDKAGAGFSIDTSAVTTSGVLRDRSYAAGQNIKQALEQLSEVEDGFDFAINPATREFELFYPRQGTRQPDLVIEDGIRKFSRSGDAKAQASQVVGLGLGEGDDQVKLNRQDSSAVAEYKLTQRVFSDSKISNVATLEGHVLDELAYYKTPPQTVGVTIGTAEYNPFQHPLGVEGRLKYASPYRPVNEFRRLIGFDIVWEQGDERAVLFLAPVVNV